MKPTVRVSIGGFAFNLEEDAYDVLNDYLQSLKRHFQGNPEADEIISDIEQRMSELLQIRMSKHEGAVSIDDALEIVKIMGNPKDFGDNVSDESQSKDEGDGTFNDPLKKKRLFRDIDNKVFGGVCSGLAHYFKIDMALVRLLFVGLFFLSFMPSFYIGYGVRNYSFIVIGVYIVLWIIMPAAKTFSQKLLMTGADPSIENIEEKPLKSIRKYRGSGVSSFFGVVLNVIVGIIIIFTIIFLIAVIVFLVWLHYDTDVLDFTNYLILLGLNTFSLKFAAWMICVLPLFGFLCLMLKILRRSSFTALTLASFILGFVIWLGSAFYLGNKIVKFVYTSQIQSNSLEEVRLNTKSNNLYVKLSDEYKHADTQPNVPILLYKGDNLKERRLCVLPNIFIVEDSTLTDYNVEIYKKNYGGNSASAKMKVEKMKLDYTISDSLLVLSPNWYDNENPWDLGTFELTVKTPKGKSVELAMPLQEHYDCMSFNFRNDWPTYYRFQSYGPISINISKKRDSSYIIDSE